MASAIASNLLIYANRLDDPDPAHAENDVRVAARAMRHAAAQLDKHLRTIKRLRSKGADRG